MPFVQYPNENIIFLFVFLWDNLLMVSKELRIRKDASNSNLFPFLLFGGTLLLELLQ
jgi:hypothetical protein